MQNFEKNTDGLEYKIDSSHFNMTSFRDRHFQSQKKIDEYDCNQNQNIITKLKKPNQYIHSIQESMGTEKIEHENIDWTMDSKKIICPACDNVILTMVQKNMIRKYRKDIVRLLIISLLIVTLVITIIDICYIVKNSKSYAFTHVCPNCSIVIGLVP